MTRGTRRSAPQPRANVCNPFRIWKASRSPNSTLAPPNITLLILPVMIGVDPMKTLTEVLPDVDQLSEEDQAGLAAHLLANLRGAPLGPDARRSS